MKLREQLQEFIKEFSFRSLVKSNIVSVGAVSPRNGRIQGVQNSSLSSMAGDRYMSTYYLKMQELKDYEVSELSNTVVGIFQDYLTNYFSKESNIIAIKNLSNDPKIQSLESRINGAISDLNLVEEIKLNLRDIIYYGSYCIKLNWNKTEKKFFKDRLCYPNNVVTLLKKGKVKSHLVVSNKGKIFEVTPNSIIRFGVADLSLDNDLNSEVYDDDKEDTLIKTYEYTGGTPLYYNIIPKIKEFLLKDQILSLLSIKDLIQPLLLLVRVEKSTSADDANRLALNTENLINKYSDISSILTSHFSVNDLMDSLINNIRVLPDYQSTLGDMNSVDLSKISSKIAEIRGDQEGLKESILTSIGIPRALFSGDVTKWEAIKASQRLNSSINSYITQLKDGLKRVACNMYFMFTETELNPDLITVNLFNKTEVEYSTSINNAEIVTNLLDTVTRLLDLTEKTINDSRSIDSLEFSKYVLEQFKSIDPGILKFINENSMQKFIQEKIRNDSKPSQSQGLDW